jgi:hypothetical protein
MLGPQEREVAKSKQLGRAGFHRERLRMSPFGQCTMAAWKGLCVGEWARRFKALRQGIGTFSQKPQIENLKPM